MATPLDQSQSQTQSQDRPLPSRGKPSPLDLSSSSSPSSSSSDVDANANANADTDTENDPAAAAASSSPLPFPQALPRSDFTAPTTFDPAAYLSALPHRHQTLDDLAADLGDRSAAISLELLDLVNANSATFLSLGTNLRGGDDRVQDLRVALLAFRRSVHDIAARLAARRLEADGLTAELRLVRAAVARGRAFVEVAERLASLEERLALGRKTTVADRAMSDGEEEEVEEVEEEEVEEVEEEEDDDDDYDEDDEDEDEDDTEDEDEEENDRIPGLVASPPSRLMRLAQDCEAVEKLFQSLPSCPLMHNLTYRLSNCRKMLLLDLSNALKESRKAGVSAQGRIINYLAIYRTMGAQHEAVRLLKA